MNTMYKITLVDFFSNSYVLYANGRAELDECLDNLGNSKWKATSIKTIKNNHIDIAI